MSNLFHSFGVLSATKHFNYSRKIGVISIIDLNHKMRFSTQKQQLEHKYLPQLPVPDLSLTIQRLKTSVKPFAQSLSELENLYAIIDEFSCDSGVAHKLHRLLQHKARQTSNWLSHDWWINKAYLEGRDPIIIWSNPGLIFPNLPKADKNKKFVLEFITRLIVGVIDFRNFLKNGGNPEVSPKDVSKAADVCMDQYSKVFGTCREPGNPIDSIQFGSLDKSEISIIIARNNKFYKLLLYDPNNLEEVYSAVKSAIFSILIQTSIDNIPVGCFTSLPRNDFATIYPKLSQQSVKDVVNSDFVVNIDNIKNSDRYQNDYYNSIGKQILHSDIDNIGNRWFDKTVQLIIAINSDCDTVLGTGFCYEHTPAEGPPIVKLMEHTVKHLASFKPTPIQDGVLLKAKYVLEKLSIVPTNESFVVKSAAEFAVDKYSEFIYSLDLEVLQYKSYGKDHIKALKFSPDSWIQVAICYAYYRVHNEIGACYETASTRKFAFGRTETIRSVTNELSDFVKAPNYNTLCNAIESHKQIVGNSLNGNGIDRILLGLNCVAQEIKLDKWKWGLPPQLNDNPLTDNDYEIIDKLYKNELFVRSKTFKISTSQVATIFPDSFMCYGPLVSDGYGCCYNPSNNQITFAISALKQNNGQTSAIKYKTELESSLQIMNEIMSKHSKL